MKQIDYCINEYFSLKEVENKEDIKDLPIFKTNPPPEFLGFYVLKCKTEIRGLGGKWGKGIVYQLRHRIID